MACHDAYDTQRKEAINTEFYSINRVTPVTKEERAFNPTKGTHQAGFLATQRGQSYTRESHGTSSGLCGKTSFVLGCCCCHFQCKCGCNEVKERRTCHTVVGEVKDPRKVAILHRSGRQSWNKYTVQVLDRPPQRISRPLNNGSVTISSVHLKGRRGGRNNFSSIN